MFLWFGNKTSLETVRGGRKVVADCPGCGVTCKFHECRQEKTFSAYVVVPLWKRQKTVFRCTNCGDVFEMEGDDGEVGFDDEEIDSALDQERAHNVRAADRERAQKVEAETRERQRQAALAKRREQQELLRRAEERARQKERKRRQVAAARDRKVDDDLAALKRKMGLK